MLQDDSFKKCLLSNLMAIPDLQGFVIPHIVVEIEYTELTSEGLLRYPSFKAIRQDKKAKQVSKEWGQPLLELDAIQPFLSAFITHPNKIIYPNNQINKLSLTEYYEAIHWFILLYITNWPLAIFRCPQGIEQTCFFQKPITQSHPTIC